MACFHPQEAWLDLLAGGRPVFKDPVCDSFDQIVLPCRKCIGCRKDQARNIGVRCYHESKMHDYSVAITLTYDEKHMPNGENLCMRDVQLFLKRLRTKFEPKTLRFFYAGEYGGRTQRPHYHMSLFGEGFDDRKPCGKSVAGFPLYESQTLSDIWGKGLVKFNDLTLESAMYAAQYAMKKAEHPPEWLALKKVQEFARWSRRPGLGYAWLERFPTDVFKRDWSGILMPGGNVLPVPEYYERKLREWCEDDYSDLKDRKMLEAQSDLRRVWNSSAERLVVREAVLRAGAQFSKRDAL